VPTDRIAAEMNDGHDHDHHQISTSVKPLLRMLRLPPALTLFLFER